MPSYHVIWEIDIDIAEGHRDAARQAFEAIQQPETLATVFEVIEHDATISYRVDLLEDATEDRPVNYRSALALQAVVNQPNPGKAESAPKGQRPTTVIASLEGIQVEIYRDRAVRSLWDFENNEWGVSQIIELPADVNAYQLLLDGINAHDTQEIRAAIEEALREA